MGEKINDWYEPYLYAHYLKNMVHNDEAHLKVAIINTQLTTFDWSNEDTYKNAAETDTFAKITK